MKIIVASNVAMWQIEAMKTTNWTTSSGVKIEVTAQANYGLDSQGRRKNGGEKVVVLTSKVNGKNHSTIGGIVLVKHPVCVAKLGQIGLTAENLAAVNAVIEVVKAEIAEHNACCTAHSASLDALGNGNINKFIGA